MLLRFFGWQDRNKLLKIVSESDVALIPHIKSDHTDSTIPHKLFQYIYAEKPILASNCAPIERIVKETNSGFIYEYNNVDQLANIMTKIINKEYKLDQYTKGKPFVVNKYNWEETSKTLLTLYKYLIV